MVPHPVAAGRSQLNWYSISRPFCFRNVQIMSPVCVHQDQQRFRLFRAQGRTAEVQKKSPKFKVQGSKSEKNGKTARCGDHALPGLIAARNGVLALPGGTPARNGVLALP